MAKYIVIAFFLAIAAGLPSRNDLALQTLGVYYVGTADGKSFFADRTKMNWTDAQQYSKKSNMTVASITSKEQFKLLSESYSTGNFEGSHWLNGRDVLDSSQYAWHHDNSPIDSSFITIHNQPALQNCLYFWSSTDNENGVWVSPCAHSHRSVLCEINF